MRRFLVVALVVFLGLPLVAATPSLFAKPNVMVYPFSSTASSIDREASSRLATIIATEMANTGQVAVVPPPPGTERKDFLTVARSHNADYYVSGFITPLGNGVSIVEQVVSVTTGIVIFSQSAQLNTYTEAAGQGDDLALIISRHANRGLAAIGTAPPQTSPTPAPSSGPEANLGKLFGRKKKPASKPAATAKASAKPVAAATAPAAAVLNVTPRPTDRPIPTTVAAAPSAATTPVPPAPVVATTGAPKPLAVAETYAVVGVEGTADATLREYATQRLLARTNGERVASASAACAARPVRAVLTGSLSVRADAQFGGGGATFELTASNCSGKQLWRQTHSNDAGGVNGLQLATERAVDAAIGAYLNPPKHRKR